MARRNYMIAINELLLFPFCCSNGGRVCSDRAPQWKFSSNLISQKLGCGKGKRLREDFYSTMIVLANTAANLLHTTITQDT